MKIRFQFGWAALAALLMIPSAWAQGTAAAPEKIGILNMQIAITSTAEGKQASSELQAQFAPRQAELETTRKQIEDIQTRLRNGASTLSDEEKQRLVRENDTLTRSYQRKQQDFNDDGNEAQREVIDRIGRRLMEVVEKYARDNGYSLILDNSSQNTPVIFSANAIDVSQDIIRLFDQAYPAKAGTSGGSKPATQRPAASKPAAPTEPPK
jgi:outer membrane protein